MYIIKCDKDLVGEKIIAVYTPDETDTLRNYNSMLVTEKHGVYMLRAECYGSIDERKCTWSYLMDLVEDVCIKPCLIKAGFTEQEIDEFIDNATLDKIGEYTNIIQYFEKRRKCMRELLRGEECEELIPEDEHFE